MSFIVSTIAEYIEGNALNSIAGGIMPYYGKFVMHGLRLTVNCSSLVLFSVERNLMLLT